MLLKCACGETYERRFMSRHQSSMRWWWHYLDYLEVDRRDVARMKRHYLLVSVVPNEPWWETEHAYILAGVVRGGDRLVYSDATS